MFKNFFKTKQLKLKKAMQSVVYFLYLVAPLILISHTTNANYSDRKDIGMKYTMVDDEELSYFEAFQYCEDRQMSLANVMNATEQEYLLQFIRRSSKTGWVWLGGRRQNAHFFWELNRKFINYTNWASGEPNGPARLQDPNENCIGFKESDGKWNNMPCDARRMFVCRALSNEDFSC